MRTNEERSRLIHKRTAEIKREKQNRIQRGLDAVCIAVCLLLVTGIGAWMPELMTELIGVLEGIEDFSSAAAEPVVLGWITDKGYHMGNVMNAFRLTVVGECKGPHMFDITELLGKEETIRRVKAGIENIKAC